MRQDDTQYFGEDYGKALMDLMDKAVKKNETPQELYDSFDSVVKQGFADSQLVTDIYCAIKSLDRVPESDYINHPEQFDKIELLIKELRNNDE
ncbi:hypothetical protein NVP1076O_05 [Vibrio phage 1.076.O._10N.286.51.B7]|nr:hypothetical protein NVP1076O_05 [Vibrio phage 1.076.O._10N.286.51.B7]